VRLTLAMSTARWSSPAIPRQRFTTSWRMKRCSVWASRLISVELLLNIVEEIIAFYLFWRVNVIVAGLSLCAGIVGIAAEAVALIIAYVPLQLAISGSALSAFNPEQLHALVHFSMQLQPAGLLLSWVFYGLDELAGGFLIFRSGFLPRILGVLLGISGACYLTNGFLCFLKPALDARIGWYLSFACLPGEFFQQLVAGDGGIERRKVESMVESQGLSWRPRIILLLSDCGRIHDHAMRFSR